MLTETVLILVIILLLQLIGRTESVMEAPPPCESQEHIREPVSAGKVQQRKIRREILGYLGSRDKHRKLVELAHEKKKAERDLEVARVAKYVRDEMAKDIHLKIAVADAMGKTQMVKDLVNDLENIS
jgi:hypothetical protein